MTSDGVAPGRILTPDQRPRVFISSTLAEMAPERAAARRAVESLGLIPVMFELGARPHPARALYRAYLAQSHVFVGLYFERYGWVAPEEDISGLEDEYRLSAALPRLVYVRGPAPQREARLGALLDRIRADDTVSYHAISGPAELEELLRNDLAVLLAERFLTAGPGEAPGPTDRPDAAAVAARPPALPPAPLTTLVGRSGVIARLEGLLAGEARLVTLVGPGGIGKTRVAVEVARRRGGDAPDLVAFVPLETLGDPAAVLPAVAVALGIGLDGGVAVLAAIAGAVGDRRVLLVLDNMEHLLGAGVDLVALLQRCPRLAMLVTSRAPLRVRGERQVLLEPLALPALDSPAAAAAAAAVQLFVARAQEACPGFGIDDPDDAQAVAQLCRRLEGIPLAIELAAARSRVLPPRALLERVSTALDLGSAGQDVPERQRTVRATLAWSEHLLPPGQRDLLARLSVFAAPWTLADAEAVAAGGDVLDDVAGLVENSLATAVPDSGGDPRFRLYETVRAYAGERLAGDALAAVADSFVARMAVVAELLDRGIRSREHDRWRAEHRLVWPDLRKAWEWALERRDAGSATMMATAWVGLWLDGRTHEIADLMAATVALAQEQRPAREGDLVLSAAGLAFNNADYARAAELLDRLGGPVPEPVRADSRGAVHLYRGYLAAGNGDLAGAEEELSAAVAALAAAGEGGRWVEAFAHSGLGSLAALRGDLERAQAEQALAQELGRAYGNVAAEMQSEVFLAALLLARGDDATPAGLLLQAAQIIERYPYYEGNAYAVEVAAAIGQARGDALAAARALGVAEALREVAGASVWPLLDGVRTAIVANVRAALEPAVFDAELAVGRARDPRRAAETVRDLLA